MHADRAAANERESAEAERRSLQEELARRASPDPKGYQILDAVQVGKNLVLKVLYPNCARCAYEGNKVMVFLGVTAMDALKWKSIDPHFRDPKKSRAMSEAPSPAARFPASTKGWEAALHFADWKKS